MSKLKTLLFMFKFYLLFITVKLLQVYYKVVGYKNGTKDIFYMESTPEDGAGYVYRVKHWLELLSKDGIQVEAGFLIRSTRDFFRETSDENLQRFIINSIVLRIKQIHYSRNFKMVIVRRNLLIYNQYGNNFMEKLLRSAHPNRLLDFDDDIGTNKIHDKRNTFFQSLMLTSEDQFYTSLTYFNDFIVGSEYLKQLVKLKCTTVNDSSIQIIPTCVNYSDFSPKDYSTQGLLTFGWIGGNQNLILLKNIIPALNQVSKHSDIELIVMSGVDSYDLGADFPVYFEKYSLDTEVDFLKRIDIGLMPLNDDDVSRGKCGFKLLQYMGVGVPGIASAITVNKEIIRHDWNGWLIEPGGNWEDALLKIILKRNELPEYGANARKTVEERYTFKANYNNYKNFILKVMSGHGADSLN